MLKEEFKRHLPFWLIIYLVWTYIKSGGGGSNYQVYLIINVFNIAVYMVAYYTLRHIYIPRFFSQRKFILFAISLVVTSLLLHIFMLLNDHLWFNKLGGWRSSPLTFSYYLQKTIQYYSPPMILLAWETHISRAKEQERLRELEKEKLTTELKYLKAQLNPHFLFNTLNNIYSQVITQSKAAPDMILQLSGILDYVLYKSQQKSVALSEEVETIKQFLGLEQIRYGDRLAVSLHVDGNQEVPVSPLLFLSLVENAFKHGVSTGTDNAIVKIGITEQHNTVVCKVWNSKSDFHGKEREDNREGIGLTNIKRQLSITYPDAHTIHIDEDETSFCVRVTIKTNV